MIPSITEFIESGVLELYVMGATEPEETRAVEQMAREHAAVREELATIRKVVERYAVAHAVAPRNIVKPMVLATIDYLERMKQGELPSSPPVVTPTSRPADYAAWLDRPDMVLPSDAENIYAKVIGYTPVATTAILWVQDGTDEEKHHEEYERFLILEGTCDMICGGKTYPLASGDYFAVPLDTPHRVHVTSREPCKAILQRLSVV
ncbi:cupin domain-containing protein [Pontibacter sp. E15-1]|uniref:cupin domain-containing protein n=1 Tax=Pontibacter sp. E15-1 TaxID=2919918 RepID=UPI001F4F71F6|nr:cupin domain-containing protein [Pontibacter sp. E15-1]MCJ8164176.1 cupin domain-containing protein [Pontibacter sp. E15-1]